MAFKFLLTAALLAGSVAAATNSSVLKPGVKWEICIDAPVKHASVADVVPKAAKLFDIDLSHAHDYPGTIPVLKGAGAKVICYFNAGAVQSWDSDKAKFPEDVKGTTLGGPYTNEWYIDIRDSRVVDLMKKRLDGAVAVGCDGVDPDNVDAWEQDGEDPTGFSLKPEDYADYLTSLADYAHTLTTKAGAPLLVGQKNAPEIAPSLHSVLDFAVLESCRRDDFCAEFQPYITAGKPVLQIEYPPSIEETGSLSAKDEKFYCEGDKGDKGFSRILKFASEQLDGWGQYCGGESFVQPTINE